MTSLNHQFEPDLSANANWVDANSASAFAGHVAEQSSLGHRSKWFDRQSVDKKLSIAILGNTLVLAILVAVILSAAWFFTETGREHAVSNLAEARSNNAVVALYDTLDSVEIAQNGASQTQRDRALEEAGDTLGQAVALLNEPIALTNGALPSDYSAAYFGLRDQLVILQPELNRSAIAGSGMADVRERLMAARDALKEFTSFISDRNVTTTAKLFDDITTFLIGLVVASAVCVLGSIFGARRVASGVSRRLAELTSSMGKIVAGDTATQIPSRDSNDEIGDIARALEVFRQTSFELGELTQSRARQVEEQLEQQKQLAEKMRDLKHDKSQLLENLANGFEVSVGDLITSVSAASEQLKATSVQMVELADGSNDQADSASGAMKSTSSNVTAAAAATDEFALSINEISQQATASATLARDATSLVASANTRMSDLSVAAEEVGEIAGLIQTIAKRTNLLALNASIEAARGGEAGRGFAVVASEVKELAMQTSAATSSVAEKINAMQDSTRSSASDLTSIYDQIGELEKVAVVIATAVDQQSVSGEELARNIDTVAEGSRQVSELLVALRSASEETGGAAGDVVSSANALGVHANDLREKAGRFIADVRRSARDLEADDKAA